MPVIPELERCLDKVDDINSFATSLVPTQEPDQVFDGLEVAGAKLDRSKPIEFRLFPSIKREQGGSGI